MPRLRWIVIRVVAVIFLGTIIELLSLGLFSAAFEEPFSFAALQEHRREVTASGATGLGRDEIRNASHFTLHPYAGYCADPDAMPEANDYGFGGAVPPFTEVDDDRVHVALLGGSVAGGVADAFHASLLREFERLPKHAGKKLELHNFAMVGTKQPQQLGVMAYFLSLGARFDAVVNLDGFNEIFIASENAGREVNPRYPHLWDVRTGGAATAGDLTRLGALALAAEGRSELARTFSAAPLRWSVTLNTLWYALDRRRAAEVNRLRVEVNESLGRKGERVWRRQGPENYETDPGRSLEVAAAHWARSSRLIDSLAKQSGALYLHFLQPNQYVPESKTLTAEEAEIALEKEPRFRPLVEHGYPHFREKGRAMREDGITYFDLTMLFRDVSEAVYSDECCHFNERGNEILGARIARAVARLLPK